MRVWFKSEVCPEEVPEMSKVRDAVLGKLADADSAAKKHTEQWPWELQEFTFRDTSRYSAQ